MFLISSVHRTASALVDQPDLLLSTPLASCTPSVKRRLGLSRTLLPPLGSRSLTSAAGGKRKPLFVGPLRLLLYSSHQSSRAAGASKASLYYKGRGSVFWEATLGDADQRPVAVAGNYSSSKSAHRLTLNIHAILLPSIPSLYQPSAQTPSAFALSGRLRVPVVY